MSTPIASPNSNVRLLRQQRHTLRQELTTIDRQIAQTEKRMRQLQKRITVVASATSKAA
jgi:septal ring factor EnvC (AmiA/AmiB activator)